MKINYPLILKKNMNNVLKDILYEIHKKGLQEGHHLYITFKTNNKNVIISKWLKEKYPDEMTIVIQHEYWDLKISKEKFEISLSFDSIKSKLSIPFNSICSFADPYANFGLKLNTEEKNIKNKNLSKINKIKHDKSNIIDFVEYKKLN